MPGCNYRRSRAALVHPRETTQLDAFIQNYIDKRNDIKPGTRINLEGVKKRLIDFFGTDRKVQDITAGDAEDFRQALLGQGKAENTVQRAIGRARQFFGDAIRRGLIESNPFQGMAAAVKANPSRFHFVTREDAQLVLDACSDAQWRMIFCLARYGGLRCPSEVLALKWEDVDWKHNRMRVPSPKTEHLEGGESRLIPLFPELREILLEGFEQAEPGTVHVITKYRVQNSNLRTYLHRIIRKAGLEPWPKTFQNLRSTRETELAETFPIHVVCKWIGNSEPVAKTHYLQTTDEHFERAVRDSRPKKATQNPTQKLHETPRSEKNNFPQESTEDDDESGLIASFPDGSETCKRAGMTGLGLEPRTCGLKGRCSTN